jgi:protein TonB
MSKIRFVIGTLALALIASLSVSAQSTQQTDTPQATTPAPTRVPAAEQEKKLSKRVAPIYPKDAYDAKLTGIVNLETTIGADGKVTNVRPLGNANALLVKAAEDAVKQWVYKPTTVNGMKIEVVTIVSINFKVGE